MPLVTLKDVLKPALAGKYAVGGLVCLGWEDMRAYVRAAEAEGLPVILQAGPSCRAHTPLPVLGRMMRTLAEGASVPVVAHLDHGYSFDECREALDCGFTSLMYDGSAAELASNIEATARVAELAHSGGVSCEGEIGFVGYDGGAGSQGTDPREAAIFARDTGVDALAVSVGNVHLQQDQQGGIDVGRVRDIESAIARELGGSGKNPVPLVIHGGSGVPAAQRRELARNTSICKFNIGTELRMAFGAALRAAVAADSARFDRVAILSEIEEPLVKIARTILRNLSSD